MKEAVLHASCYVLKCTWVKIAIKVVVNAGVKLKMGRLALVGFVCVCVCVCVRARAAIDTLVVDSVIYYRG